MTSSSDVLIIGGGAIGLAIAIELALRQVTVTVLSRNFQEAAVHAAAGMLAPQAEGLAAGPLRDLALRSRNMYPDWIQKLEGLTGLDAGYWPCGILAPLYAQDWADPMGTLEADVTAQWLEREEIEQQQPNLSAELRGGWWFSQDAQVDNRALAQVLSTAALQLGVTIQTEVTVTGLDYQDNQVRALKTSAGNWQAQTYVLATGAWSANLLSIPVFPRKGQMLSMRSPAGSPPQPLNQVLFGTESYIVPRRNGRIVIGATSEDVGFTPHNTPSGIMALLAAATRLYPPFQEFILEELWWGFRPATPDEWPILGASPYENLTLATGHYRNGILLAPITAQLIADWLCSHEADPLLPAFSWQRFG